MGARKRDRPKKPTLPEGNDWSEDTVAWFGAWASSPVTDGWDERQWQYMFDTALVHNLIYAYSENELLPELERRLRFMGLSFGVGDAKSNVPRFL